MVTSSTDEGTHKEAPINYAKNVLIIKLFDYWRHVLQPRDRNGIPSSMPWHIETNGYKVVPIVIKYRQARQDSPGQRKPKRA